MVGSAELAYPFTLSGRAGRARGVDWGAFSISAFADAAYAANVEDPQPRPDTIVSVGVSLTWQPSDAVSLRLTYGSALVDSELTGTTDLQDRGFHARFTIYPLRLAHRR